MPDCKPVQVFYAGLQASAGFYAGLQANAGYNAGLQASAGYFAGFQASTCKLVQVTVPDWREVSEQ